MRKCVAVLAGVAVVGVMLQLSLLARHGPPAWLLQITADTRAFNVTPAPTPAPRLAMTSFNKLRLTTRKNTTSVTTRGPHDHHPYRFILNEPDVCSNRTELVIVVITALENVQDRQAVRETWGSYRNDSSHHAALVFLLGATSDPRLQARVRQESVQHRDIVQEDFVDSYRNLSLKSVAMLKWVTMFCNSSRYVLKADDDMYVNVANLMSALRKESLSHSTFVLGHVFTGAVPVLNRKSKWYTPTEAFSEKVYPRYASGTAYSMTTSAARKLYAASAEVPVFWLEDIYVTGLCSRKAGVSVYHNFGFSYNKEKVDGCHFRKAITGHRYSAEEKRTIFRLVNDPGLKCR